MDQTIIARLDEIENKLNRMEIDTNKMGKHVDNVEFLLVLAHPIINVFSRMFQKAQLNSEIQMNLDDGLELD